MAWVIGHPVEAVTVATACVGALAVLIRFGLHRHREYLRVTEHMKHEEEQVWPQVQLSINALQAQMLANHEETLRQFAQHGERLARVEGKMPNGEISEMHDLLAKLVKARGQSVRRKR